VVGYRVYKEDGEPVIEFEGEKTKVLSFLLIGAIDYHLYRLHEILKELDDSVTTHYLLLNHPPKPDQLDETSDDEFEVCEEDIPSEEPPVKKPKINFGICREAEFDAEKMQKTEAPSERLRSRLSSSGLVMYIMKDAVPTTTNDDEGCSSTNAGDHTYVNTSQIPTHLNEERRSKDIPMSRTPTHVNVPLQGK
jgi:hypothetical protein